MDNDNITTPPYLRLLNRNIELVSSIKEKLNECKQGLGIPNADLNALSLTLRQHLTTFETIRKVLQDNSSSFSQQQHQQEETNTKSSSSASSSSQAQKDALTALTEILSRCEILFKDLHPVFVGIERLRGSGKVPAENALRGFLTAKAGLRTARVRLQELQESVVVVFAVVCVHGFIGRKAGWTGGVDVGRLIGFRRTPVRYGVDGQTTIKLHTLVAKTILAARIHGVGGLKVDESVDGDTREMIEAWTASEDGIEVEQKTSEQVTTRQNEVNKDDGETNQTVAKSPLVEKQHQADPTQDTVVPSRTKQKQAEEISPKQVLDTAPLSKGRRSFSSNSNPNFQRHSKAIDPQTAEPSTTSTTKAQTTKLDKKQSSAHRRASLANWVKKWYKPR